MKNLRNLLVCGCAVFLLSGCAAVVQNIAQNDCNTTKAYNQGLSDSAQGLDKESDYANANFCSQLNMSQQQMNALNFEYDRGYNAGLYEKAQQPDDNNGYNHPSFTNQYMAKPATSANN